MPGPPDPLARLKQAHASKRRADERFRAALLFAHEHDGASFAQIAEALGWTRQRVRQQLIRWFPPQP